MSKNIMKNSNTKAKDFFGNHILKIVEKVNLINKIYIENFFDSNNKYEINKKEKKIMNTIFKYLSNSLKNKDIKIFLFYKEKKFIQIRSHADIKNLLKKISPDKINIFISNFINLCIINSEILSKYCKISYNFFFNNFLKITKFLFLSDIINEIGLKLILGLQLFLCLYNKDNNKSAKIENINKIYLVIDFLVSLISNKNYKLNEEKIEQIYKVISFIIDYIKKNILTNFINVCILSRDKLFFKLIGLCQITTYNETKQIIDLLVEVYKYKLNIDFIFDDLSCQFLYKIEKDNLKNKTKLLMAKNNFLNNIFKKETQLIKGEIIKNGFYFSDFSNNGILCEPVNIFPSKNGYSLVVSFKLMYNNENEKNKFTIFSLTHKYNNIMKVFIEDFKLKIQTKNDKKVIELYSKISPKQYYILWITQTKAKKDQMIIFLNGNKTVINTKTYPGGNYIINLGCNINKDNSSIDNFEGIIGTFILFRKSLIKDENDYRNITKLIELKGNYEGIPYNDVKKEWSFVEKNINLTLNLLSNDIDKNKDIELIISSKSFGNDNLIYNSNNILADFEKGVHCNYFQNPSYDKKINIYIFRNKEFLVNNLSFPIFSHNSFFDFLNGHGFLYLQLELYYLISVLSLKIEDKTKEKTNKNINIFDKIIDEEDFYTYLTEICSFFFFCLDSLNSSICFNSTQNELFQNEIKNFKYTLIDLETILSKYNCKINIYFLMLFCQKLKEKKYFEYCSFILNFEFYDPTDSVIFNALFTELNHLFEEDYDITQIKTIFHKLLSFEKLYLSENTDKNIKKEYSKIIRLLLEKSIDEELKESLDEYNERLKKLKTDFANNNPYMDVSNIQEEDYINGSEKPSNKLSMDSSNYKEDNIIKDMSSRHGSSVKRESVDSISSARNNKKNLEYLILIYKYLKNLYISISSIKEYQNNYIELYEDKKDELAEFFNELFFLLERVYPIEKNYSDKDMKKVKYAEYIKCLCIRFLDDFFFRDNYKFIKEEEEKLKNKGEELEDLDNKSSGNSKKSNISVGSFLKVKTNYNRGNLKGSFIGPNSSKNLFLNLMNLNNSSKKSSFISNYNLANNTVEEILTGQMEFFNDFFLSQYTFRSLFLILFRDLSNDTKIKYIKNNKQEDINFLLKVEEFDKIKYLLKVIIKLLERLNSDEIDSCFMTKEQLIEYTYKTFSELLKNTLKAYLKTKKRKEDEESMIKSLFICQKSSCYADKFYKIMLRNISSIKEDKEKLLTKILNDMKEFINDSLFNLEDQFYYKTIRETYFEGSNMDNIDVFIFNFQLFLMEILDEKYAKKEKNKIIEINCKNTLILLYKTIFFVNKRNKILENELYIKEIFIFLSQIIDHSSIIYTRILFPIEDSRGKLLIEIIYEIIFELYLEYLKNPKIKSLQVAEPILKEFFNKNKLKTSLGANFKDDSIFKFLDDNAEDYSPFYIIDKISDFNFKNRLSNIVKITDKFSINKSYFELKKQILETYANERTIKNNYFSVCILFSIKIILSIKELYEFYSNNRNTLSPTYSSNSETNNSDTKNKENNDYSSDIYDDIIINELKTQMINLCKNIQTIQKESNVTNPFKSMGYYSKNIYEHFHSFIVDKVKFKNEDYKNKIFELIEHVNNYSRDLKFFMRVIYTREGRTIVYNEKNVSNILSNIKKQAQKEELISKGEDNDSFSEKNDLKSNDSRNFLAKSITFNSKIGFSDFDVNDRKSYNKEIKKNNFYLNISNSHSQNQLFKKSDLLNKINIDDIESKIIYEPRIKFKKDLIRIYFSLYFQKILTYDGDFNNIKKLFTMTYDKEIENIDQYEISYPIRFKNYICSNYDKIFLKRDFDFFYDGYFKYSHNYLFDKINNYNYKIQEKILFPNKNLIRQNDSLFKEIFSKIIINNTTRYECEMVTLKGSIFGNIYILDNCLLFKSEIGNDKRIITKNTEKDYGIGLLYACCSIDYDFLKKEKIIIMEYKNIKEVINRTFAYIWISFEIFLKDGRSFLFNLFNQELQEDFFEILKRRKVPTIQKVGLYFRKEEFSKKWKEEKISTYDYLLLLNKFSSRSYNDTNQYLVMPWLFLIEGKKQLRNFDLPISVQDENTQEEFLSKGQLCLTDEKGLVHGNHYSTSAYLYFYLMRTNPFTNMMIRFQSNYFDVPDRQYFDIKQTINLCQYLSNNREMIPELYSIPEIYMNLNDNDFGKQKGGLRVHNITFEPYANTPFQFCYLIKDLLNNNAEINNQIHKWFDFIFGVNQLGNYSSNKNMSYEEKEKYRILRKFNVYSYGKLFNYNKIFLEAQKHSKDNKSLFDDIRTSINLVTNFGQCPYQILNEIHPSKNKYILNSSSGFAKNNYQNETYIFDEIISCEKSNIYNNMIYNKSLPEIKTPLGQSEIIFFTKSSSNDFLYCLLKNGIINIYKLDPKMKKNFVLDKEIKPKCQFLSLKETKIHKNQVFNPKYLFCEINENSIIFGRTLDRTLIYYNIFEDWQTSFLLKSHTISIISIKNNEFITGIDNGHLCKWHIDIDNKEKKVDIELLLLIKSNKNAITSLYYDEKLNIIISSDINTLSIRKIYDFEYLNSIKIKESKGKYITDIKISEFNFIYALIYVEETDYNEIQSFTINGTYFGKYEGIIFNFQLSKTGKLIVNELEKGQLIIKVLNPVNFYEMQYKEIVDKGVSFNFFLEKPNIIYYGIKDDKETKIKIIAIYPEESHIFYMNDIS